MKLLSNCNRFHRMLTWVATGVLSMLLGLPLPVQGTASIWPISGALRVKGDLTHAQTSTLTSPSVSIPSNQRDASQGSFRVPINFASNGASIAAVGFALAYDQACLNFNATDSNNDGVPDAITGLPNGFVLSTSHNGNAGVLNLALTDYTFPINALSDGALLTVAFTVKPACMTTDGSTRNVTFTFASEPAPSFSDTSGNDVNGTTSGATIPLAFNVSATSTPTATPTAPPTNTASPTATPTETPTASATASETASLPATPTATPTATNTVLPTASATATNTASPSATPTATPTATATTQPSTATPTASPTNPAPATATNTPLAPTATPTQAVTQHDCTQDALVNAIKTGGTGVVTLDGACRYLLTRADFNNNNNEASGELIAQASVIEGNGAIIERVANAPQFRLFVVSKPGIVLRNLTLRGGNSLSYGGALWVYPDILLENVRIEANVAAVGGGLFVFGNLTLRRSTLTNNQATFAGGGAYVLWAGVIEKSSVIGNRTNGYGGGLFYSGQSLQINNSIFARNQATQMNGGAQVHVISNDLRIMHSTFSDNAQNSHPAIFINGALNLQNSIVTNHVIGIGTAGDSTYLVSEDYNLFAGNGQDVTVIYNGSNIARGSHSFVALDPRFVDATSDNYRLAANSPAINAGTTGGPPTDADGKPRPVGDVADLGAYEFQGQPVAALQIAKEAPPWIVANRASRYALTVFNAGRVAATGLQISEQLPSGATYVANSASDGGILDNGTLTWAIGDLAPGASKRVEYWASANQTLVSNNYRVSSTKSNVQETGKTVTTPLNEKLVAAIDFQPNPDGFAFPNYGDSPDSDLTADDMAFIFGASKVCKSQNPCVLTAAAEAWRKAWLLNVQGGHCAGMAMGSLDIFANTSVAPGDFQAGANVTFDLTKPNLRRFIALYATTQTKYPTTWATLQNQGLAWVPASTPATVLDTLIANFNNPNAPDRYRLSIARTPATGGGGGHTVVPYAIEKINNNEYLIYIYENNAPNDYTRAISVNRATNTWSYVGTTAPGQPLYNYYGSAADNNISLVSWRWATTFPKVCDSACTATATDQVRAAGGQLSTEDLIEFQLDGEGYLLVTRNDGKRVGFDSTTGAWINEIAGADRIEVNAGLGLNQPPLLQIPHIVGATYRVQVSNRTTAFGNLKATANVNIFGTNFAVRLTGLQLNSPELTPVDFGNGVVAATDQAGGYDAVGIGFDPANSRLTYQASASDGDTPAVSLAVNNPNGADYSFTLDNLQLQNAHSLALAFDKTSGALTVENNDSANGDYSVAVARINQDGTSNNYHNDSVNDGGGVGVVLNVGNSWDGTNAPVMQENQTPTLSAFATIYLPLIHR